MRFRAAPHPRPATLDSTGYRSNSRRGRASDSLRTCAQSTRPLKPCSTSQLRLVWVTSLSPAGCPVPSCAPLSCLTTRMSDILLSNSMHLCAKSPHAWRISLPLAFTQRPGSTLPLTVEHRYQRLEVETARRSVQRPALSTSWPLAISGFARKDDESDTSGTDGVMTKGASYRTRGQESKPNNNLFSSPRVLTGAPCQP
jgi:hypothetical protein